MKMIAWLMLAAAIVPFLSAILAKAGGQKFDNNDPRPWLARQEGWRARANAAQSNASRRCLSSTRRSCSRCTTRPTRRAWPR